MSAEYDPANQSVHNTWGQGEGYGVAGGIPQSANTQHSAHQDHTFSLDQAPYASGDPPSNDDGASDGGDYDPEAVTSSVISAPEPTEAPLRPSPQPLTKKPKSAGGFLVGDSDSEDDAPTSTSNRLAATGVNSPLQKVRGHSPLQHSITTQEASQPPPSADASSPTSASVVTSRAKPGDSSRALTQSDSSHDKVTVLEDRVREDPRGAMDAWMGLMAEYRLRNWTDEARSVYERFVAIFPQAVSPLSPLRLPFCLSKPHCFL